MVEQLALLVSVAPYMNKVEIGNQEFTSQYLEIQVLSASLTGRDIVFPHEGMEVGSEQTHLFGRPGDIPVVSFQGLEDEGVLDFL